MGKHKNRRNRKRHLTDVNTSGNELSNAIHMAYQSTVTHPNMIRLSTRYSLLPHPGHPYADIPSRFSSNSVSRRWLSPIPFQHSRYDFLPVRVPVAIVPPLPGAQAEANAVNTSPVPSTLSAPNSLKSSETQALIEETKVSATSSEQTATNPVTLQPTIHQDANLSHNTAGSDIALSTETPIEEDDVVYLYRVEPEKEKLIEVVDLSEDSNEISSNRNLVLSSQNPTSCKETETEQDLINKSSPESQEVHSSISASEKSKGSDLLIQAGRKRKREENYDTQCSICHRDYEGACKESYLLFISKCGHIFCLNCLRSLVPYKCTECNAGISNLCKVIF